MSGNPLSSYSSPRISVIVPLYNTEPYLAEALSSIQHQTVPLAEVIVVDDGSTDGSAAVAERFPFITLVRKAHGGICETLNRGLEEVTGEYLAFLDADDRWLPEKTARQLACFERDSTLDMVFGRTRRFLSTEKDGVRSETTVDVMPGLSKASMLIRRSSFLRAGRFPEVKSRHDFLSWYFQARTENLRSLMLPDLVLERRIHQSNHGIVNKQAQRQTYFLTLKDQLERRRAASGSSRIPLPK